ncbi:MAG TPA: hypothetical protein PK280_19385 [Planctomycetota bacterium]|nr:hypothetical protein [Planctomycetota bacterium]
MTGMTITAVRHLLRIAAPAALLAAVALLAAGCEVRNIDEVRPGMVFTEVETVMGSPEQKIHGDRLDAGKTTWVYPQGKVLFQGIFVIKVEKAGDGQTITERAEQQKSGR